jgi:type VI secretion system secreted protein Hcp
MTKNKKHTKYLFSMVYTAVLLCASLSASAAVDMFLKIEGIDGEASSIGHEGSIDILSWSWGASNPSSVSSGGAGSGKVSMQDFHFTKYIDKSSPNLFLKTCDGQPIPSLSFTIFHRSVDGETPYLTIQLEEVFVSSTTSGGSSSEDKPLEQVSFTYSKIVMTYYPQNSDGSVGKPITFGWDLATNKKV